MPPRKPGPAWLTDIATRSWFRPFGSFTITLAEERLFRMTFFKVTHWPVTVFSRWNCTDLPANVRAAAAWMIQPLFRPSVSLGCTCTEVGVAYAPFQVAW